MGDLYVARDSQVTESQKGEKLIINQGDVAEEGHYLVGRLPHVFRPLEVRFSAPAKSETKGHQPAIKS